MTPGGDQNASWGKRRVRPGGFGAPGQVLRRLRSGGQRVAPFGAALTGDGDPGNRQTRPHTPGGHPPPPIGLCATKGFNTREFLGFALTRPFHGPVPILANRTAIPQTLSTRQTPAAAARLGDHVWKGLTKQHDVRTIPSCDSPQKMPQKWPAARTLLAPAGSLRQNPHRQIHNHRNPPRSLRKLTPICDLPACANNLIELTTSCSVRPILRSLTASRQRSRRRVVSNLVSCRPVFQGVPARCPRRRKTHKRLYPKQFRRLPETRENTPAHALPYSWASRAGAGPSFRTSGPS